MIENFYEGGSSWIYEIHNVPDICNLRPGRTSVQIEWRDIDHGGSHRLMFRKHVAPLYLHPSEPLLEWESVLCKDSIVLIQNLEEECDYEFKLMREEDGVCSALRIARTGFVPGSIVCHHHKDDSLYDFSGRFLGSPSLLRLPDGALLCCMDVFGMDRYPNLGLLYRSNDNGETWRFVNRIRPIWHTKIFLHKGKLYLLGVVQECGDLIIGCSEDYGYSWTMPVIILKGTKSGQIGPQRGSLPVLEYHNRLYTSLVMGDHRCKTFMPGVLSIDANADLLNPDAWHITPFTKYNYDWPDAPQGCCPGSIEGNMIVGPDGRLYDLMRLQQSGGAIPHTGKSILYRVNTDEPDEPLEFVQFVDSPLACSSKFDVKFDVVSHKYIMLGNEIQIPDTWAHQRTVLSMASSDDLVHWKLNHRLIDYSDHPINEVGFQYPDYVFDGNDILTLVRTSLNGAANEHDSNYIILYRFNNFRQYL